jgi:hypothetical protein
MKQVVFQDLNDEQLGARYLNHKRRTTIFAVRSFAHEALQSLRPRRAHACAPDMRLTHDQVSAAWVEHQQRRWMRPDASRWLRPDCERQQRPQLYEHKYSPAQPRVPAGNPDGGQWTSGVCAMH